MNECFAESKWIASYSFIASDLSNSILAEYNGSIFVNNAVQGNLKVDIF